MVGIVHGDDAPSVCGASSNFVKSSSEETAAEDCCPRKLFLGDVYLYDSKIQDFRNQRRLGGAVEFELTREEEMVGLFKEWRWGVMRGVKSWEDKEPWPLGA